MTHVLDVKGKRVVVVGLGASGVAACKLLHARGAKVVGTDQNEKTPAIDGVEMILGGHERARLDEADLVVVSPGVPSFPELESAERGGVPIWGEIELATRALAHPAPIVAIGGTNGKSTVTTLVGLFLEANDMKVFTGGNLGEPLASHADEEHDVVVLEVSSFQMERLEAFRPDVGVLLNITADHLDRYASMGDYANAKGNCFERQTASDLAVVPRGDEACARQAKRGKAKLVTFGPGGDFDVTDAAVVDHARGVSFARDAMALSGGHNALNVAASLAAVSRFEIAPETILATLREFRGLPHRTAHVAEIDGVHYYDDSKGTNVGASVTAVLGLREAKVVLIAGGRDKGGSYAPLAEAMRGKGRAVVVIGEAAERIAAALAPVVSVAHAASMDDAVRRAKELALEGDAVLLSPACSSYDMFRDYKHRGDEFVRAVKSLGHGGAS